MVPAMSDGQSPFVPADSLVTPRFSGIRTFARLPEVRNIGDLDAVVVGFPFDTATSYRPGARFGPEAIRSVSVLLRSYHAVHDVDVFGVLRCGDGGDVRTVPGSTPDTYDSAAEALFPIAATGGFPLVLGGDHSISIVALRALAAVHGPLGLVHLDAHSDTWDSYFGQAYFHGTTFRRAVEEGVIDPARSIQAGLRGPLYNSDDLDAARRIGFAAISAEELRSMGPIQFGDLVRQRVGLGPAFLSFDVDFCDPAYAPGTGTPEVGGLTSADAQSAIRALTEVKFVGADVVETSPPYDGPGQQTALLAANVAWEILALRALEATARPSAAEHPEPVIELS